MRPGDHIGQYALVRYIGKGGMAEVWEARHLYLNKGRLALKFLLPQFATNHELQERFLKEAQRQLDHPNIIAALASFAVSSGIAKRARLFVARHRSRRTQPSHPSTRFPVPVPHHLLIPAGIQQPFACLALRPF